MLAELSFWESVGVEFAKALFAALLVAGLAALVLERYRRKTEEHQSALENERSERAKELEAQRASDLKMLELDRGQEEKERERALSIEREKRQVRSEFVKRVSELGGDFYVRTQEHWRRKRRPEVWGEPDPLALDDAYGKWASMSAVLENELEFRYGAHSRPWQLWHQSRDLLTVRYFTLRDQATDRLRERNSKDYKNELHSGLTVAELRDIELVLDTYHLVMRELANEITTADVSV